MKIFRLVKVFFTNMGAKINSKLTSYLKFLPIANINIGLIIRFDWTRKIFSEVFFTEEAYCRGALLTNKLGLRFSCSVLFCIYIGNGQKFELSNHF